MFNMNVEFKKKIILKTNYYIQTITQYNYYSL